MATYYKCEIEGCDWLGGIRSKVKNKDSEHYGKKVCPQHAHVNSVSLTPRKEIKRTPIKASTKRIKPLTEKTKQRNKERSEIRNAYFDYHLERAWQSEESGKSMVPTRANICHIFPKRTYLSVQGNLDNCVYLTLDEHTRFDQLLDTHNFDQLEKEFQCWDLVVSRIKKLMPEVEENGKLKILLEAYLKHY